MARTKNSPQTRKRRKKVLNKAEGYFGSKSNLFRIANEQVLKSEKYAYRDRRTRKRDFRSLWIIRINAAARENNIRYSELINGLNKANVKLNRKILSEIAIHEKDLFSKLVSIAKNNLEVST